MSHNQSYHEEAFSILPSVINNKTSKTNNKNTSSTMRKKNGAYLMKYILTVNFLEYLEAGAVPALLMQLKASFNMSPGIKMNSIKI